MTRKILLDTNAYLRLGELFHPLVMLDIPGKNGGRLWILPDLHKELNRSPRLRHSFAWTRNPEMLANRKSCRWRLPAETKAQINSTYNFAMRYSQQIQNAASPFDIRCLAYGLVLGMPVVTDDQDMRALADELEIETLSTLELLRVMTDAGLCDIERVESVVKYWIAVDDLPANYRDDFRKFFGRDAPAEAY